MNEPDRTALLTGRRCQPIPPRRMTGRNSMATAGPTPTCGCSRMAPVCTRRTANWLQYRNVKADYVDAWWNVVNWADVAKRFDSARTQTSGLVVP